jgi:hypothetical protein
VLIAQLVVYLAVAIAAMALLVVIGKLTFDVPLPRDVLGFIAAYLVGMTSLFALSLLVAAVASTSRAGTASKMHGWEAPHNCRSWRQWRRSRLSRPSWQPGRSVGNEVVQSARVERGAPEWERWGEAIVDWLPFGTLAVSTVLCFALDPVALTSSIEPGLLVAVAVAWV